MSVVANGRPEPAALPPKAKASAPRQRCKSAGGATLGQDNGRDAQTAGGGDPGSVGRKRGRRRKRRAALNVSVPRYYQMETRALRGLVEAWRVQAARSKRRARTRSWRACGGSKSVCSVS